MAVLSDLHATTVVDPRRSWVREGQPPQSNPLAGLPSLIEKSPELRADVLLCPGDLCDQADWSALPYAWSEVKQIANLLGAERIVATTGNHDIDTYDLHGTTNIHEGLLSLGADYPFHPPAEENHYWANRASRVVGENWQVISLNSCLMERLEKTDNDHGTVDDLTLDRIRDLADESLPVNILLCHHHPQPFNRIIPDNSHMNSGDRLVNLLDELPERWMIVHGHKHEPHLDYMGGTGAQSTRLVAGSVGVVLWAALSAHVRNQLHLIEFPIDECAQLHLSMAGRVRSWTWRPTTKWKRASEGDGLPATAGFGYHRAPAELAAELIAHAQAENLRVLEREHLNRWQPRLPYLLPADLERFQLELENTHGCHVSIDLAGYLDRVVLR